MKNPYQILGVSESSTEAEIKSAYRKLAIRYHPDKNPGNKQSEEKFKDIAGAYEILSDPFKKSKYDGQFTGSSTINHEDLYTKSGAFSSYEFDTEIEEILKGFFFTGNLKGRTSARKSKSRGEDVSVTIEVTLEEIALGAKKIISINKECKCESCNGIGGKGNLYKCNVCKGSGETYYLINTPFGTNKQKMTCDNCSGSGNTFEEKCNVCGSTGTKFGKYTIKISIPKGIMNGSVLSVNGCGNAGKHNGQPGDLRVTIEEKHHDLFQRKGKDLYCHLKVNYFTVIYGGSVEMKTLNGKLKINIPADSNEKEMRVSKKGIDGGDLYVTIGVYVPYSKDILNDSNSHTLLSALSKKDSFNP